MGAPQSGEFVPFVPRRVGRSPLTDVEPPSAPAPSDSENDAMRAAPSLPAQPPFALACDPAGRAAAVREEAVRLAGLACARALHEAIARNPLFVVRFVDDALRASGEMKDACVRLRPVDAATCADAVKCDVVADDALEPGEVVVESECGTVRSSIEERATRLVLAAADE